MKKIISGILFTIISAFVFADFNPLYFVPFKKPVSFVIGEDTVACSAKRTLKPYAINSYETTYGLWYKVRIKAEKLGYNFENPGQAGTFGKRGAEPTEDNENQPVTTITWYDAIVWCNALSEIRGKTPCYTFRDKVIRDSSDTAACDLSVCDFEANGFRLPTEAEWEYAAICRHQKNQSGSLISGQQEAGNPEDGLFYAWTSENANRTRVVGTAGIPFDPNSITEPGTGNPNTAGIFDMSGNVMEYCWDWFAPEFSEDEPYGPATGYERVSRGGSVSRFTPYCYAGDRYSYDPNEYYNFFGFRLAYTIK